jgi:hypothetical protein
MGDRLAVVMRTEKSALPASSRPKAQLWLVPTNEHEFPNPTRPRAAAKVVPCRLPEP